MKGSERNIVGNVYDKYGSKNPVARWLMQGFLKSVRELYAGAGAKRVLEVGCGEGRLADDLVRNVAAPEAFCACDLSLERLAPELHPMLEFREASIYDLPFADGSYDLVICCEVLEHLERPELAVAELARVSSRYALVSTPREPLWRVLNLARGRYVRDLGNTPGHVQHFNRRTLGALLVSHFRVLEERSPLPWTMYLCERL